MPRHSRLHRVSKLLLLGLLLLGGACAQFDVVVPEDEVFDTRYGKVAGVRTDYGHAIYNLPYAAAPVGELRFAPPQPVKPWDAVRGHKTPGVRCWQPVAETLSKHSQARMSEDCLRLNVFTPVTSALENAIVALNTPARLLPVLVYFHPGGFAVGSGSDPLFRPDSLVASSNVVVVTVNYRLGAFGFLSHAALDDELEQGSSGNAGMLDQQAALRWVAANIKDFGGNANNVIIMGHGAGASSVAVHLMSVHAGGLFHAAVLSSMPDIYYPQPEEVQALRTSAALSVNEGCAAVAGDSAAELACLRQLPADELVSVAAQHPFLPEKSGRMLQPLRFGPVADGHLFSSNTLEAAISAGAYNRVPLLIGSTTSDAQLSTVLRYPVGLTWDMFDDIMQFNVALAARLQPHYRRASSPRAALTAVINDFLYRCPARRIARAASEHHKALLYRFAHVPPAPQAAAAAAAGNGSSAAASDGGSGDAADGRQPVSRPAYHLRDVKYWFGSAFPVADDMFGSFVDEADEHVSALMQEKLSQFMHGLLMRDWPAYEAGKRTTLRLAQEMTLIADSDICDIWDENGAVQWMGTPPDEPWAWQTANDIVYDAFLWAEQRPDDARAVALGTVAVMLLSGMLCICSCCRRKPAQTYTPRPPPGRPPRPPPGAPPASALPAKADKDGSSSKKKKDNLRKRKPKRSED